MAMVSAVQEAQKDNLRNFSDYMMTVLEDDWQKEKRDFLHSLSRISSLARTNVTDSSIGANRSGPILSLFSSPHISSGPSNMELLAIVDKKAATYVQVVRKLNDARKRSLEYKSATAFKNAYDHNLGLDSSSGNSVTMNKIWHLIQGLHIEGSESRSEKKGFAERKKGENEVDLAGVESREEEEAGVQNFGGFSFPPESQKRTFIKIIKRHL
ncbi:unnamed protein product [Lactuca saligna]|uniref:Uncharacterized protein n=1 Tax=Lactuca saligna TaxID=75948 RepID=A0AA36EP64_LACSI|nr:unnamed protein product [Lactuca saligna]